MAESPLLIPVAILIAVLVGNWLFLYSGDGTTMVRALIGVASNLGRLLLGALIMVGGTWFHIAVGGFIIMFSVYGFRSNKQSLNTVEGGLRSKLNG